MRLGRGKWNSEMKEQESELKFSRRFGSVKIVYFELRFNAGAFYNCNMVRLTLWGVPLVSKSWDWGKPKKSFLAALRHK
jgi:hypothetical protein